MDIRDIDLNDRDRFARGVPHEWFTYLRNNAPMYKHPEPDGPGYWVATKHEDVFTVSRDAETFSSDQDRGGVVGLLELTPEEEARREEMSGGRLMLTIDPPEHTRYRSLVNKGFTPRMVNALEDHFRELTEKILDDAIAKGECDFVVDVAAELPLLAIAELLGVPVEDRHKVFEWSNKMIGTEGRDPEYGETPDASRQASIEMYLYAQQLAEERRKDPRDDIVTRLLDAEIDGDRLSEMDFNLFFLLLSVAGNETTRNAMSHGLHALIENPDQYAALADDPEGLISTAVEEIVRWASPVMYFRRNVTRDTEIRGQEIKAGDKLSVWYIAANRDEEVFDDPFRFDVARSPNDHIAFGAGGPHFCLGANLARLEIKVLFEELVKRVSKVELVGDVQRLRSNFINGIKHMPVRLTPAKVRTSV